MFKKKIRVFGLGGMYVVFQRAKNSKFGYLCQSCKSDIKKQKDKFLTSQLDYVNK